MTGRGGVHGVVSPGYAAVREQLAGLIDEDHDYSAQFCAYVGGRCVVDLWGGSGTGEHAVQGVFSATKGAAAVCVALLLERGLLDLDEPVSRYWPEFAQGGKATITVRTALSHQAGLPGVEPQLTLEQVFDHEYLATRLAVQVPHWYPGTAHGYHGLTIGTLADELVRRLDGRTVARFFDEEIGAPRDIDFFIATPDDHEPRVLDVLPQRPTPEQALAMRSSPLRADGDTLSGMAFNLAVSAPLDVLIPNVRRGRAAGQSSAGGVGSARGLARLYASCIGEVDGAPRLLSPETVAAVSQIQAAGPDIVLGLPVRYGIIFQKPDDRLRIGSHQAFGHDGAGGALGVADPWHDLAYGYVPRRMTTPGGADERGMDLARTVRRCHAELRG
ncbi:serine hydrolase domain-containing protein [Pseudonocardia nematodicida]|uniref:Serine hydrolase domain-containing protein n=1 Tax=Pseudonocardia nematodicida TaxID=1206997 RepID=A0ABV1KDY0_9PSEU